jgi:hypothetical protein
MSALKFALRDDTLEGWAIPFGSPDRRDRTGEYFTPETDLGLSWFRERPLLLGHGLGPEGPAVVGRVVALEKRPEGIWARAVLDRASAWYAKIVDLLGRGALAFSSATMPHLAKVEPDGRITRWPFIELSLTTSPASPDARIVSMRSAVEHYGALGYQSSALKSVFVDGLAPDMPISRGPVKMATPAEAAAVYREWKAIDASLSRRR